MLFLKNISYFNLTLNIKTEQLNNIYTVSHVLFPANINWFKVNNRSTRKRCEICPKLTITTP